MKTENRFCKKLVMLVFMLALCVVMLPVNAKAASKVTFQYTNSSTIKVKWEAPGYSGETVQSYAIYDTTLKKYVAQNLAPTTTSFTSKELKLGYVSTWRVEYTYTNRSGSTYTSLLGSTAVNNKPAKINKKNIWTNGYPSQQQFSFGVQKATNMTGTDVAYYVNKKGKVVRFKYSSSDKISYLTDTVYYYKARAYYTNPTNGKTYVGDWTTYKLFEIPTSTGKYRYDQKGLNVAVKYCSGVKNYTIAVSTNRSGGYKATAVLTPTKNNRVASARISKMGKATMQKGITYYVAIIPNIYYGNATVKSDLIFYYTYYCSR